MSAGELHLDRGRAESFGSVAEQYDRFRPAPVAELVDRLAALAPRDVLDVGCGTGKVAAALVGRGLPVLGIEPDEQMAAVARGHGVEVEVAAFERWEDGGRRFDLLTCGSAWHWIDPVAGPARAAEVLRPGGTLARCWTYYVVDESASAALDALYAQHAPEVHAHAHAAKGRGASPDGWEDPVAAHAAFEAVEAKALREPRSLSAEEWAGLAATYSDHLALGPERLAALQQALRETIAALGGTIEAQCETFAVLARRH